MEKGSDKVSARLDEELKSETEGLVRANRETRAEEWHQLEPSGEDQPDVDLGADGPVIGGTPAGMDGRDVEGRAELAGYLGAEVYPAVREQLIGAAMDRYAPDRVVDELRRLPSGRVFHTVSEVWEALGGHVEHGRF